MTEFVDRRGLRIDSVLADFIEHEAVPGSSVDAAGFWDGLAGLVSEFGPRNRELLATRERLQQTIDGWHRVRAGQPRNADEYRAMLESIGYIVPTGDPFAIETERVDAEIATVAGPQLVVPSTNARYALNASNARWGSLYDAVYGTDVLGDLPPDGPYDAGRGARVVAWTKGFLDDVVPLEGRSWTDVTALTVEVGHLVATQADGSSTALVVAGAFVGHRGHPEHPAAILLRNNGLGIEIQINRNDPIGADDRGGIADVQLESAVTAIIDLEDSVATVDGADKALAYHNWLGLMKGDLVETVTKGDRTFVRELAHDRAFVGSDGSEHTERGRALLLVRNVGHLMTTPAVVDSHGNEVGEGILDALVSVLAATHDLARAAADRNSPAGSVYVVKPKMHGPDEVSFTNDLFQAVERILGLPINTVKIGIMDEERRTTVNLGECIRAARNRVAFINTGFLDRTGDEIHTSMLAGPMVRKADMRAERWITAYEDWNVDVGLACGLPGRAQIGKGMWAAPDRMGDLLQQKIGHPQAGANCAWVPSPTAATLHATHYHRVDVHERQRELSGACRASLDDLLAIPTAPFADWSADERRAEVDNNAQGILGYVVRWIEQGVGCSKVPDIHGTGLMEDRATCRISSQHIANWMLHDIVSSDEVIESFHRMAAMVDRQNDGDPLYEPMAPDFDNIAFRAALDLVLQGTEQPSGYTEPILHRRRLEQKRDASL